MARPLRIIYPHACYHVMNRGAGHKNIFRNNLHRNVFLDLLNECHTMFNIHIHAYCLMDNHYHLLLSTPDANLSRAMRHLNGLYTQAFNRLMDTDGPLFRGRYTAKLVDEDCYRLVVSRYIHLNPVSANITVAAADYKWSSYRAYLGLVKTPSWISIDVILNQLSSTTALSHIGSYEDYVENSEFEDINVFISDKHSSPIIGSESFKQNALASLPASLVEACSTDINHARTIPDIESIMACVCQYYEINRSTLLQSTRGQLNWPKLVCIYIARKRVGHTNRVIASAFSICRATISSAVKECAKQLETQALLVDVNTICEMIKRDRLQPDT